LAIFDLVLLIVTKTGAVILELPDKVTIAAVDSPTAIVDSINGEITKVPATGIGVGVDEGVGVGVDEGVGDGVGVVGGRVGTISRVTTNFIVVGKLLLVEATLVLAKLADGKELYATVTV
jgi:hypothetical protein